MVQAPGSLDSVGMDLQEGGMKRMQEDDLLDSQLLPYFPCVFFFSL